jgi:hypothetical protein
MPEGNLFLLFSISPEAIQLAELEQQVVKRGLEEAWRQVQEGRE